MPYASAAQRAFFNVPENKAKLEAQGVDVGEWNRASEGKDLPARAKRKKTKKVAVAAVLSKIACEAACGKATKLKKKQKRQLKHAGLQVLQQMIDRMADQNAESRAARGSKQAQAGRGRAEKAAIRSVLDPTGEWQTATKTASAGGSQRAAVHALPIAKKNGLPQPLDGAAVLTRARQSLAALRAPAGRLTVKLAGRHGFW